MTEVIIDALIDSAKVLPFLFVVYVLIEIIEKKLMFAAKAKRLLRGKYAPLIGVGMGLIPQCGFSVMATNLYLSKNITVGTLLAVFIATSDEAIPILISNPATAWKLFPMLAVKVIYALFIGYLFDVIFRKRNEEIFRAKDEEEREKAARHEDSHEEEEEEIGCCHHELKKDDGKRRDKKEIFKDYVGHPLIHSIKVFVYILIINFAFGTLIYYVGQEKITLFLSESGWYQPFVAGLIGLIPNCAASVIVSQLYILGGISFGSCVTGLSVNAGIALALLFRKSKKLKDNLFILAVLYLSGVILGLALTPIPW